jgi:hypothetical protein
MKGKNIMSEKECCRNCYFRNDVYCMANPLSTNNCMEKRIIPNSMMDIFRCTKFSFANEATYLAE